MNSENVFNISGMCFSSIIMRIPVTSVQCSEGEKFASQTLHFLLHLFAVSSLVTRDPDTEPMAPGQPFHSLVLLFPPRTYLSSN